MSEALLIELNRKLDRLMGNNNPTNLSRDQEIRSRTRDLHNKKKLKRILNTKP